jgi:hypothetical protein
VDGVQFQLDGASLGAADSVAPYTVAWDSSTAADGVHTLTAVAWDAAGNQTRSTGVTVTVSNAAAEVTLAWDANTESNLSGYKVYVGDASGVYTRTIDVANITSFTVTRLQRGHVYYFAVTAYDQNGHESDFSSEVNTRTP